MSNRYSPQGNLDKIDHNIRMIKDKGFSVENQQQLERAYSALETVVMEQREFRSRLEKNIREIPKTTRPHSRGGQRLLEIARARKRESAI